MTTTRPPPSKGLRTLVRVRMLLRSPPGRARLHRGELRETLQDLVDLIDGLQPYLVHPPGCDSHRLTDTEMYGRRWPRACSCGLAELVDETRVLLQMRPPETAEERRQRGRERNA